MINKTWDEYMQFAFKRSKEIVEKKKMNEKINIENVIKQMRIEFNQKYSQHI